MKIEIFIFFESVDQKLSSHVHNVKILSQEPLKSYQEHWQLMIFNFKKTGFALELWA